MLQLCLHLISLYIIIWPSIKLGGVVVCSWISLYFVFFFFSESKPADSEKNVDLQLSCEVNPQIDAAITELQRDFRECVSALRLTFTESVSAIKELLQSELPAGEVKGQVGLLLTQSANMRAIRESTDTDQLFMTLSNINAWDFLHPQLLEYLVVELRKDEAEWHIQKYKSALIEFRNKTKMSELAGWSGNIPENPLFQKIVLKLGGNWKDKTYQQFEEVRISLLRQQVFDKSLLGFCGALPGSILVALFTPKDIDIAALEQALKLPSLSMFMKDNEISAVYVKGICLIRDVRLIQKSSTILPITYQGNNLTDTSTSIVKYSSKTFVEEYSDTSDPTLVIPVRETDSKSLSLVITPGKLLPSHDSLDSYYKQRVEDLEEQLKSQRKEFTEFRAASSETMKELEERMKESEERMKESEERMKKLEKMLEQMQALPLKS